MSKIGNERVPPPNRSDGGIFVLSSRSEAGARRGLALLLLSLVGVQLGHFLYVDAYTLAVKKHEIHRLDGRGHC